MDDDSHETLKAILLAMGIDDVESMPPADVVTLARQLGVDVPEHSDHDEEYNYAMEDDSDVNLNTAFVADESTLDHGMTDVRSQEAAAPDSSAAVEDSSHDDSISQFCSITGSEPNDARYYLEACGWDLESAIPLFMENAAAHSTGTGMSTTPPHRPFPATFGGGITGQRAPVHRRFGAQDNDDDAPGIGGMRMQGIGGSENDVPMPPLPGSMLGTQGMHEQHINAVLQNMMRSSMGGMQTDDDNGEHGDMGAHIRDMMAAYAEQNGGSAGIAGMGRRQDRYDEDGVRMPDPVQRQRLVPVSRSYSAGEDEEDRFALGRAEDPSVEWMFPPPRHLSSQATLEKARAQAQQEGRWLLVNIQSHEQFASHRLNRDTWVHETIESILRTSFLFWQRGHTSRDGAEYMRLHRLTDDDLPHIGIIDPRTGAKLLTLTGFMSPDDLCIRLVEFVERRPYDRVSSSAPRSTTQSAQHSGNVSGAASNADSGHNSDSEPDRRSLEAGNGKAAGASTAAPSVAGASSTQATAVETPTKSCNNYGVPPSEPAEEEEGVVKISIKLSNGKAHARRYRKTDKVAALFAVAAAVDDAARVRDFDLVSRYPALSLQTVTDKTLEECGLAGSQLILKFL